MVMQSKKKKPVNTTRIAPLGTRVRNHAMFYVLLLPAFLVVLLFMYAPMGGLVLAFKQFKFNTQSAFGEFPVIRFYGQIANMDWVGLKWFNNLFSKPDFWQAFRNTLVISFGRLLLEFPAPIILALLMNEMRHPRLKRVYQTLYTFPHFLSWVLVASLINMLFTSTGTINQIVAALGGNPVKFLTDTKTILPMIFTTSIWKGMGWGSIIYLATISSIDPTLYEAAKIDGANRWQSCWHITWPSIRTTVVIMLIMQCGQILNAGFDQVFNLYNDITLPVADIFDTFIYRYAFQKGQNFSLTVAAGLFKSVCNFALLLAANGIAKLCGEEGLL